ncbi:MAG: phosphopantetheine-binding protein, partial [Bacteroidota bacterium]
TLQAFLGESLPEYMIPTYFVPMEAFPLNGNGKIDRKQLPNPSDQMQAHRQFAAAESEMEQALLDIWKELLKLDTISCTDNFFQIGGNSLLAAQLVARIKEKCGLDIRLRMVFTDPSIRRLALSLDTLQVLKPLDDNDIDEANEVLI